MKVKSRNKRLNLVHVGASGFPKLKTASVNRYFNLYSMLPKDKFSFTLISNRSLNRSQDTEWIQNKGIYKGLQYRFTTPTPFKPQNFFQRRYYKIYGKVYEFNYLLKLGFLKNIDVLIFYPRGSFFELLGYRIYSKIFNLPLIGHYVELRSGFKSRNSYFKRINDWMFDNYYMFLVDGLIPISNYLWQHVRKKRNIKMLKIPPIADFDLFSIDSDRNQGNYFLYVGSSVYYQPVMKILDAFKKLEEENFNLVLVLHGSGTQKIRNNVEIHPKKNKIFIYSGLSYEDLVQLYVNAKSLIVPLSNSLQDIARFPNKISEYLASSNPIITNRVGEVENYFTDGENALVAELNASDGILEKMQIVVDNPEKAEKIGYKGYELGLKYFDKNSYKKEFETFITNFVSKN